MCLFFFTNSYAETNLVTEEDTTYSSSATGTWTNFSITGSEADCYDENESTNFGGSGGGSGEGSIPGGTTTIFEANFGTIPYEIHQIKLLFVQYAGSVPIGALTTIEYYDGSWHTLSTNSTNSSSVQTIDDTGLKLLNVTKVKVTVYSAGRPQFAGAPSFSSSRIFELYVYGLPVGGSYAFIMD